MPLASCVPTISPPISPGPAVAATAPRSAKAQSGLLECVADQVRQVVQMGPGGDLRHDATIGKMLRALGQHDFGQDRPSLIKHRGSGFIAGGLDAKHGLHKTAFTSPMLLVDGPLRDTVNERASPGRSALGVGWAAPERAHIIDRGRFGKVCGVSVVLITRPEPGASETAARLEAMGLTPIIAPALLVEPVQLASRGLGRIAATLLTSSNAIAGCPPQCVELPAFAVGDATAARARAAGFTNVRSAGGDAVALADLVVATLRYDAGSLLLPTGHSLGADLARDLRSRGFRVVRRTVYRIGRPAALPAVIPRHLLRRDARGALFFSAETARHFVNLIQSAGLDDAVNSVAAISISERAGVALRALPWRRISVASRPNQDAMLALLQ